MLNCLFPQFISVGPDGSRIKQDGSSGRQVYFVRSVNKIRPFFKDGIPDINSDVDPLSVEFQTREDDFGRKWMVIPCGQCVNCRRNRAFRWKTRILMEMEQYDPEDCCFLTLTYDDAHLPDRGQLNYKHVQKFLKNLRENLRRDNPDIHLRFFACGEYGELFGRPHYHLCLFGYNFFRDNCDNNIVSLSHYTEDGKPLYCSARFDRAWSVPVVDSETGEVSRDDQGRIVYSPRGIAEFAELSEGSAAYVAGYCVKKLEDAAAVGKSVQPFIRMSLKPALGSEYIRKHLDEILRTETYSFRGRTLHLDRFALRVMLKEGMIDDSERESIAQENALNAKEKMKVLSKSTSLSLQAVDKRLAIGYNQRRKIRDMR